VTGEKWANATDDGVRITTADRTTSILLTERTDFKQIQYGKSKLWARASTGIYSSSDDGTTWTIVYLVGGLRTFVMSQDERFLFLLSESGDFTRMVLPDISIRKLFTGYNINAEGVTTSFLSHLNIISPISITVNPGLWTIRYKWSMDLTSDFDDTGTYSMDIAYGLSDDTATFNYSYRNHYFAIKLSEPRSWESYGDSIVMYFPKQTTIFLNAKLNNDTSPNTSSVRMVDPSLSATFISY
jgi:hypothetical protein